MIDKNNPDHIKKRLQCFKNIYTRKIKINFSNWNNTNTEQYYNVDNTVSKMCISNRYIYLTAFLLLSIFTFTEDFN